MIGMKLLALIVIANGAALLASRLFGKRYDKPLDFGRRLPDGRRLLGDHKTIRGLLAAELMSALAAPLLDVPIADGAIIGFAAMAGDALSSFIKRRLDITPGGMAIGLDQIPESLLPLLILRADYGIGLPEALGLSCVFLAFELLVSRVLFRLHLREHPY